MIRINLQIDAESYPQLYAQLRDLPPRSRTVLLKGLLLQMEHGIYLAGRDEALADADTAPASSPDAPEAEPDPQLQEEVLDLCSNFL